MTNYSNREEFIKYLEEHPEERLWQAIRNYSGYAFILASNAPMSEVLEMDDRVVDTFYWEGAND